MSVCGQCGSPIKTVPAGFSKKTGKPYNEFQVCSNRECGAKPGQAKPAAQPSVANDMLVELKEIKALLCAINSKTGTTKKAKKVTEEPPQIDEEDEEETPF